MFEFFFPQKYLYQSSSELGHLSDVGGVNYCIISHLFVYTGIFMLKSVVFQKMITSYIEHHSYSNSPANLLNLVKIPLLNNQPGCLVPYVHVCTYDSKVTNIVVGGASYSICTEGGQLDCLGMILLMELWFVIVFKNSSKINYATTTVALIV